MAAALPRLDRYRLLDVIGTGGFSTVYRAVDERFDTHVAIKVLADNHAFNPEVRERFITEVQLLRRLAGIPTVAVYDLGETDAGQPYAVMALADGDLSTRVRTLRAKQIAIGPAEVNRVVDELTRSLSALHAKGIVHRDVKPLNLLVFGNTPLPPETVIDRTLLDPADTVPLSGHGPGRATGLNTPTGGLRESNRSGDRLLADAESLRLADLGFAKDLTQSGLTVGGGTPGFMPPEQARPGTVDARADVYAATAVVAWLICGETPGELAPEDVSKQAAELLGPQTSPNGLLTGMADNPNDRPPTMSDWRDMMRDTLTVPPVGVTPRLPRPGAAPSLPASPVASPPVPARRSRVAMFSTAALVGALGVGAGFVGATALGGDGTEVTTTDTGVVFARSDGALSVQITGPDEITVGDTATFRGEAVGASELRWVGPNGRIEDGSQPLMLSASRAGDGQITFIATTATGEVLEVTADFTVVETGN